MQNPQEKLDPNPEIAEGIQATVQVDDAHVLLSQPERRQPVIGRRSIAPVLGMTAVALFAPDLGGGDKAHSAPIKGGPQIGEAISYEDPNKTKLRQINQLPGYGQEVSRAQRVRLSNATVNIMRRLKPVHGNKPGKWEYGCSGAVVRYGKKRFVTTASHCDPKFNRIFGSYVNNNQWPAVNSSRHSSYDFAISDPKYKKPNIIGTVVDSSMSMRGDDLTLMKIKPVSDTKLRKGARRFNNIKPLSISNSKRIPKPGQEVALSGAPSTNNKRIVNMTGTYLGRYRIVNEDGKFRSVAAVGINPAFSRFDACNFGASGSSAILSDGTVLLSLSKRYNYKGYFSRGQRTENPQHEDIYHYDENGKRGDTSVVSDIDNLEKKLRVDAKGKFSTFCIFNSPRHPSKKIRTMIRGLKWQYNPNAPLPEVVGKS